jgi:hypothetical protein
MKTLCFGFIVFVFLVCGLCPIRAADPMDPPKWSGDLFSACMLYNIAVREINSHPADAVKALTEAQKYCIKACQDGGAQHVELVSQLIGKELQVAENDSQKAPTESTDSKPASQPATPAVNTPVNQLVNKPAKQEGSAKGKELFARGN